MDTIRRVLVPIDLSSRSTRVLQLAAELCRKHEAAAALLYVWDPLQFATPRSENLLDASSPCNNPGYFICELETAKQYLRAAGVMHVDIKLEHGRADREIIDFSISGDFDLIVMGTQGRTGLSHVLIGSVAERVVRRARCPVMTVRMNDERQSSHISCGGTLEANSTSRADPAQAMGCIVYRLIP